MYMEEPKKFRGKVYVGWILKMQLRQNNSNKILFLPYVSDIVSNEIQLYNVATKLLSVFKKSFSKIYPTNLARKLVNKPAIFYRRQSLTDNKPFRCRKRKM